MLQEQSFLTAIEPVEPHPDSLLFATGKGGIGKSTISVHTATHLATVENKRTLLLCVTSQEDDDLGIARFGRGVQPEGPSVLDGAGILKSITDRTPLRPVRDVRPGLDVVPGGRAVQEVLDLQMLRAMREGKTVVQALMRALEPIMHEYDAIVIDSAPENDALEQLAAACARWLFVPTKSDYSSIQGLPRIAANYKAVRNQLNPHLKIGAAFLYASNPSATVLHREVREKVAKKLGSKVPQLETLVAHREVPAVWARDRGVTFQEAAEMGRSGPRSYDVAAGRAQRSELVPESMGKLAAEMTALSTEILDLMQGRKRTAA